MAYTVAIIGSFQKYYSQILDIIQIFKNEGLYVLSPKESYINGKIDDFVIFVSDRKDFSPAEIQIITLDKIIKADLVYVYNPNGYVGKTTCYTDRNCVRYCAKSVGSVKKVVFLVKNGSFLVRIQI